MSKIEVDTIAPQSGTTVTLGEAGDTVNIPSGVTLTNSGTATGFGISWQSDIKTSAFTAVAGEGYWINTTSAAVTVTLPASASVGDEIEFTDYARTWNTNNLTLNTNSLNYQGNSSPNPVYDVDGQHVRIVYSGATQGWIPTVDDDVTLETPQSYSADILVVAGGGGGGGGSHGGGGGAGGFRTSTQSVIPGTVITVTVGDGGTSFTNGSDSSISGSGLTTITSTGGGKGAQNSNGGDGGSGGGGGSGSGTFGSGNTPSTSPSQGNNGGSQSHSAPCYPTGGGGGAGAVGGNASGGTIAGNGGNGTASSITGSSVTYAGGGGGELHNAPGTVGTGGTGGGGDGGTAGNGNNGTANLGGGGGGGGLPAGTATGGTGGKGVVIISVPDADYSGTTTGSPTVATGVSGKTVMTFNGSGSYTT
jgi:hypothetical protein